MEVYRSHVLVCQGSNCNLKNSKAVYEELDQQVAAKSLASEVKVIQTGCFGLCEQGPTVVIYPEGTFYCQVKVQDVPEIVEEHLLKGRVVERLLYTDSIAPGRVELATDTPYFAHQQRIVLRNCGLIDPESVEEYIATGGYGALAKCLTGMSPGEVIDTIKGSGLRGRGGAAFPTGLKWQFAASAPGEEKFVVCNADEGEPGTFKDRLILEGDPHTIIEAMAICGYATGASKGFIYIRGEYALSIERLENAVGQAKDLGFLGERILGTGFAFDIEVRIGAGAYVCGEETALFESMEGKRGEPRVKPPYPTDKGLWGKPTVINNVETLANVAPIVEKGAQWFASLGTKGSPGTKVFTLTGNVANKGLIEVPMGITLREVVYGIGGGIPGGRGFKLAQTGGTSGGIIPPELLDTPMDYDSLVEAGSSLGSGALLIIDDSHCIVDLALCFARFFQHESCGKCVPCREGTRHLYNIVGKISRGQATREDLDTLKALERAMLKAPLCALGQTAPIPVMGAIKHFTEEFLAHIDEKYCPAGVCEVPTADEALSASD